MKTLLPLVGALLLGFICSGVESQRKTLKKLPDDAKRFVANCTGIIQHAKQQLVLARANIAAICGKVGDRHASQTCYDKNLIVQYFNETLGNQRLTEHHFNEVALIEAQKVLKNECKSIN